MRATEQAMARGNRAGLLSLVLDSYRPGRVDGSDECVRDEGGADAGPSCSGENKDPNSESPPIAGDVDSERHGSMGREEGVRGIGREGKEERGAASSSRHIELHLWLPVLGGSLGTR